MATHAVRVTQEPGVVRNVDDRELVDLARQGLLHSYEHTPEAADVLAGTSFEPVAKWKAPGKSTPVVVTPDPAGASVPVTAETEG